MYHELQLIGNLGKDPTTRYTPNGAKACGFSVATNRRWSDENGDHEQTVWFQVTAWGRQGEVCQEYLKKGRKVFVKGRLYANENGEPNAWEDEDEQPRASFDSLERDI